MKDSNEIKLFSVEPESSILLNENGASLRDVIESRDIKKIYFPHPIGATNPVEYWFENFPSPSENGATSNYNLIEEKSQEARELEEYGVRVKSHGELV